MPASKAEFAFADEEKRRFSTWSKSSPTFRVGSGGGLVLKRIITF